MDMSDFGTPVTVVPPPANEVVPFQQFEKVANQDQGDSVT